MNEREIFNIARLRKENIRLTNNSDGGQTGSCKKHKEESKKKISEFMKTYKKSKEHIEKVSMALSKPVYQYTLSGDFIRSFSSATVASIHIGIERTSIRGAIKRNGTSGGFQWKYTQEEKLPPIIKYYKTEQFREKIRITNHNRSKKI